MSSEPPGFGTAVFSISDDLWSHSCSVSYESLLFISGLFHNLIYGPQGFNS